VLIPRDVADYHLDQIAVAYHATVQAFLKADSEWIGEGLGMLGQAINAATYDMTEELTQDRGVNL